MYSIKTHVLLIVCLQAASALADKPECAAPPISLPLRNASIAPGLIAYGIPVTVGTPPQNLALTPSLMVDETFIPRYSNSCLPVNDTQIGIIANSTKRSLSRRDNHTDTQRIADAYLECAKMYGGGYEPSLSTTYNTNTTIAQGFLPAILGVEDNALAQDAFAFIDYVDSYTSAASTFPKTRALNATFVLPADNSTFDDFGSSPLSLTPNSTLLEALANASIIPSTSWSLGKDSLCLGCIDSSAVKGDFIAIKPASRNTNANLPCMLQVEVDGLDWHGENGIEAVSLIDAPFTACVEPGVSFMVLPDGVRKSFFSVSGHDVLSEQDTETVLAGAPGPDDGTLHFVLKGNLEVNITIPGAGASAGEGVWSVPIGKGAWGSYGVGVWTLGRPFIEKVILQWDKEKGEFGIANVNGIGSGKTDLKPLGCDAFPKAKKEKSKAASSTGSSIGALVGGFLAGILATLAALWFFRRGRKDVHSRYASSSFSDTVPMRPMSRNTLDSRRSSTLSPTSLRGLLSTPGHHLTTREGFEPQLGPQQVDGGEVHEAPEGGTGVPSKRSPRVEIGVRSMYEDRR